MDPTNGNRATTEIKLKGHTYRIGKVTALVGCGITMQIFTKMLPAGMDTQVIGENARVSKKRTELTPDEFEDIQRKVLAVVSRMSTVGEQRVPEPILLNGNWVFKDLEYDTIAVLALTLHSLKWNFGSFFDGNALNEVLESFGMDQTPFSALK